MLDSKADHPHAATRHDWQYGLRGLERQARVDLRHGHDRSAQSARGKNRLDAPFCLTVTFRFQTDEMPHRKSITYEEVHTSSKRALYAQLRDMTRVASEKRVSDRLFELVFFSFALCHHCRSSSSGCVVLAR